MYAHPVHITVVNIEPNASKAVFEVSFKIFTDDFEAAILKEQGIKTGLTSGIYINNIQGHIKSYLINNFKIKINQNEIPASKIKFVKFSIVDDATWVYMDYKISSNIKSLELYNNLLNSLYPDMTNLVIIHWGNNEQGFTFTKSNLIQKVQ